MPRTSHYDKMAQHAALGAAVLKLVGKLGLRPPRGPMAMKPKRVRTKKKIITIPPQGDAA